MGRVLIVSNRLPVSVRKVKKQYEISPSIGGLATGVAPFHDKHTSLWIGWSGIEDDVSVAEQSTIRERLVSEYRCYPVFYSQSQLKLFYYGTCNDTLWPLFHSFTELAKFDAAAWASFVEVNNMIADVIVEHYQSGDIIWIHDYQMILVAQFVRAKLPEATIGFFLHIPFPAFDILRMLPQRDELVRALLQCDLIGFHIYDYVQNFLDSVRRLIGFTHRLGLISTHDRLVRVDAFPLGIDYQNFAKAGRKVLVQKQVKQLHHDIGKRRMLLSLDRLDYTKGIIHRLNAFARLLERYPVYQNKVTLVLVLAIWRSKVVQYRNLKRNIDRLIGQINGKYGGTAWTPIRYVVRTIQFDELAALYLAADVALITPLRDGMNLVAKEYVATRQDRRGVLVLSEMAGAAEELGEAVMVNPYDDEAFPEAIHRALQMSLTEQRWRITQMRERLQRYSTQRWADDFMETLQLTKQEQADWHSKVITPSIRDEISHRFHQAKHKLIFLDYDGTLVDFVRLPKQAIPPLALRRLLTQLADQPNTTLVIISGRDRQTLNRWFVNLPCSLVAEHGAWFKKSGKPWQATEPMDMTWKKAIRSILELYVDRTPSSSIEEKHASLVWHYRNVKGGFAELRARQLQEALVNLVMHYNLRVIEGSAVIEVLPGGISKTTAVDNWLKSKKYDLIIAAGDDQTDEDIFKALPKKSISIKVRLEPSQAKYAVATPADLRILLHQLVH